jgi:TetR/AcrR family transcriptional regulator, mexJK operon transcriptional repressor
MRRMEAANQPRSRRKREAILEAATEAFLEHGYLGTSMDEIAAAAGVSKQTVYKHFADKRTLFAEMVASVVDESRDPVEAELATIEPADDVAADLRRLARRQLDSILEPRLLALRRLVIAEAGRFPELGRTFYERGFGRSSARVAEALARLAEGGALRVDDPQLAAAHLSWLTLSAPVNRAMLLGTDGIPSKREIDRYIDAGVRVFLAAYGAAG